MKLLKEYSTRDLKKFVVLMAQEIENRGDVWRMTDVEVRTELATSTDDDRRSRLLHRLFLNEIMTGAEL